MAVLLVAGVLAFLAVRYGDRILSGFVSASVKTPGPKAEMVRGQASVNETEPQKPAAPALVPSVQEKQPPVVVEEVKAEVKEAKKEMPSEPSMERSSPVEVRAGPQEIQAEPEGQTIVVERGDTLGKLSIRVYGRSNDRVIETIQKNNPASRDPDHILPRAKTRFPTLVEHERPAQHRPVMRETGEAGLAVIRAEAAFAQPAKRKVLADHVRDGVIEADSA